MSAVVPIRAGLRWENPASAAPDGLTLTGYFDHGRDRGTDDEPQWCQLSFTARGDAASIMAAGIATEEQLATLPPCGQRTFDTCFYGTRKAFPNGVSTRITVKKLKSGYRAEVVIYGHTHPHLARYRSWFGAPAVRVRPQLRLV